MAQPVTITVQQLSVQDAVDSLALLARIRVQYRDNLFQTVRGKVSLKAENIPLGEAFLSILKGTSLQAVAIGNNFVSIEPVSGQAVRVPTGVITGKVTNAKTGQPLAGASIGIRGTAAKVVTDASGTFRMSIEAGEYMVEVRAVGFVPQTKRVTVANEQTAMIEVGLDATASVLDEVVVTGTVVATERKAIATPITVITAEEIEKRGITRIEEFLRGEVPGVIAQEIGSRRYSAGDNGRLSPGSMETTPIYSRGASGFSNEATPLKVYIDGVETLDASALGTIDPASIERIEIITGPQAATVYGSGALGGVLQIFTKRGASQSAPQITATLMMGMIQNSQSAGLTPSHSHQVAMTGGVGPGFTYSGGLSYVYTGQWQPGLFARRSGANFGVSHVRDAVTVSGAISLSLGRNGTNDSDWEGSSPYVREKMASGEWKDLGSAYAGRSKIASSSSQTLSLNLDLRASQYWQHHLTVGRNQTRFAMTPYAPRLLTPADSLYNTASANGDRITLAYNTTVAPRWAGPVSATMTTGVSGSQGLQMRAYGYLVTKTAATYVSPGISNSIDSKEWGGFVTGRVGFWEQLYLTLGLRAEKGKTYGRQHSIDWTPTTGIAYTFDAGPITVKLLGSYGKATRPPSATAGMEVRSTFSTIFDPGQIITQFPNPALRPERSSGPEGGVELYFANIGSITLNRYDQKVMDLVNTVIVDSIWRVYIPVPEASSWSMQSMYLNTGAVRQHGWETTFSLNIRMLTVKGTYSMSDSRILSLSEEGYKHSWFTGGVGSTFMGIPSHAGNLALGYSRGASNVTITSNWVGASLPQLYNSALTFENTQSRLGMYVPNKKWDRLTRVPIQGYTKSDLNASHRVSPWMSVNVNIKNIGNSYDNDLGKYLFSAIGRQTQMGLTIRLPR